MMLNDLEFDLAREHGKLLQEHLHLHTSWSFKYTDYNDKKLGCYLSLLHHNENNITRMLHFGVKTSLEHGTIIITIHDPLRPTTSYRFLLEDPTAILAITELVLKTVAHHTPPEPHNVVANQV